MQIGNTIRTRRRQKDMTQEQLAEKLCVSISAVSQWECGKSIPDLTMIPAMCSVLDITADELLGVDRAKKQEQIRAIVEEAQQVRRKGFRLDAKEILYAGLKRFPGEHQIMFALMHLCVEGDEDEREETRRLAEKLLEESDSTNITSNAAHILIPIYRDAGEIQKASALVSRMGSLHASKEVLRTGLFKGQMAVEANQSLLECLTEQLAIHLRRNYVLENGEMNYNPDEMARIHEKIITILETLYEDGDMGFTHCRVKGSAVCLANYYADKNDAENALRYLKKAAEHAVRMIGYEKNGVTHTSLVFRGRRTEGLVIDERWNSAAEVLKEIAQDRYDFIRDTDEFRKITAELESHVG